MQYHQVSPACTWSLCCSSHTTAALCPLTDISPALQSPSLPPLATIPLLSASVCVATPWIAAYQAPPSMGFSKQEYWSGVPLPSLHILYISSHLHSFFLQTTMHYASNSYFRYLLKSTFKFLKWVLLMTKEQGHF